MTVPIERWLPVTVGFHDPTHRAAYEQAVFAAGAFDTLLYDSQLSADTWFRLWPAKPRPRIPEATALVERPLTGEQINWVLAQETRQKVLAKMVRANDLDDDQHLRLLCIRPTGPVAAALLERAETCDFGLRDLLEAAGGIDWLWWCANADPTHLSTVVATDLLHDADGEFNLPGIRARSRMSRLLAWWLGRRPDLIEAAVESPSVRVRTAAAGCRHLTVPLARRVVRLDGTTEEFGTSEELSPMWLAWAYNPVVPLELVDEHATRSQSWEVRNAHNGRAARDRDAITVPYDQITDRATLEWVIHRSLPKENLDTGRLTTAKLHDLVALAGNPMLRDETLPPELVRRLIEQLRHDPGITRLDEINQARQRAGAEPVRRDQQGWLDFDVEPENLARFNPDGPVRGQDPEALAWVGTRFGADPTAWELLFSIADGFEGTWAELVELTQAMT